MCDVFTNNSKDESIVSSINNLRTNLANRNLNRLNTNLDPLIPEKHRQLLRENDECDFETTTSSPYLHYFNEIIKSYCERFGKQISSKEPVNPFFCPQLFKLIQDKLAIVPLWTGIMLQQCQNQYPQLFNKRFAHLTNNPVERYFSILKHQTLSDSRDLYPSELARKLYTKLRGDYIEHYCETSSPRSEDHEKAAKTIKKGENDLMQKATWKEKGARKHKREKGILFD